MRNLTDQIASQKFTRVKLDGTIVEWQQEDESAVKNKAEAVAMVQRTLDFWLPKMAEELQIQTGLPMPKAKNLARYHFRKGLMDMLAKPFSRRWNLTVTDFTYEIPD